MCRPKRPQWLFSVAVLAALIVSVLPMSSARAQDPDVMPGPAPAPAAPLTAALECPDGSFLAQYYSGNAADFSGALLLERCEQAPLKYDGARKPKEVNVTPWSARFTGKFGFDVATYRFLMRVDDGMKLYVDSLTAPVVDHWTYTTAWNYDPQAYDKAMTAGLHTIRVEFHDDGGAWRLFVGWLPAVVDTCPVNSLRADYYKNTTRSGNPLFSRCEDAPVHYVWGSVAGLYGLRPGNLSAHWSGTVDVQTTNIQFPPGATRYTGDVAGTGNMVAKVDNVQIFSLSPTTAPSEQRSDRTVAAGNHTIDVTYDNTAAPATVHFGWAKAPSTCGVPLVTTVGQDNEFLLAGAQGNANIAVGGNYTWAANRKGAWAGTAADAVGLDPDNTVLALASSAGDLSYRLVDQTGAASASKPLTLTVTGRPSLVAPSPVDWLVFARPVTDTTHIYYKESYLGTVSRLWKKIPGVSNAASNLAVVAPNMNHILVFYQDSTSTAFMTERINGTWRAEPVPLGGLFLSELTAVAPSPNYIAVFGVGTNSHVYYLPWTPAKSEDWSDVGGWNSLGTWHCQSEPIALLATDVNHIMLACRGSTNVGYAQWSSATGWTSLAQAYAAAATGPLTLVPNYDDPSWVSMLWADTGTLYHLLWTGAWNPGAGTKTGLGSSSSPGRVLAVSIKPMTFHAFVRISTNNYYTYPYGFSTTNSVSKPYTNPGVFRGNTLFRAGGKTFQAAVYISGGFWYLAPFIDPNTGALLSTTSTQLVTDPPYDNGWLNQNQSITAADVDGDGNDELFVWLRATEVTRLYRFEIAMSNGVPVAQSYTYTDTSAGTTGFDASMVAAVGDLDGDGVRNEVVLLAHMNSNVEYMWVYQGTTLTQLISGPINLGYVGPTQVTGYTANQLAIGKVRGPQGALPEQVVLAAAQCNTPSDCNTRKWTMSVLRFWKDTAWHYESLVTLADSFTATAAVSDAARLSTAMALGDVDGDGLKEIIYSIADRLYAFGGDVSTGTYRETAQSPYAAYPDLTVIKKGSNPIVIPASLYYRSMAATDVDKDGKAEVALTGSPSGGGSTGVIRVYEWIQPPAGTGTTKGFRLLQAVDNLTGARDALAGDTNNDSWVAELTGCAQFSDTRVMAVVNAPPRWVGWTDSDGVLHPTEPVHRGSGSFGESTTYGTSHMDGTSYTVGASVMVGFEQEYEVFGVHLGSTKFEVENEFAATFGKEYERGYSVTSMESFEWSDTNADHDAEDFARGIVAFNTTRYGCYTYDTHSLKDPTRKDTVMMCAPTGNPYDDFVTVQDWNAGRLEYGPNWFYLGHDTNDLNSYPQAIPSGTNVIWQMDGSRLVSKSGTSGLEYGWESDRAQDGSETTSRSWDNTTKVTTGGDLFGVTFEASMSFGVGGESADTTSYEHSLSMGGTIEKWPASCTTCTKYTAKPYIASMKAQTQSGIEYEYLMADYVVPCIGDNCTPDGPEQAAATGAPEGPVPQAPVVTSPTQPDPNTWYTGRDVTLDWQQPAGDPATVAGYSWTFNETPDSTPGTAPVAANTISYAGVADGEHYLHIAASAGFGANSPTTHRAVRVDATAPVVTIVLDPPAANLNGWFKTPVTAKIEVDDGAGSGAVLVEYSTDGSTWQPYPGPLSFTAETAGFTLSARATDHAGNVSQIAQREIKIDLTPPSTVDVDGYGLSYARIDQDESGNNVQLVLGGALNDNLSGRSQVEISAGQNAGAGSDWRAVDAIGTFPMPPGNLFPPGQATTLNWVYTPTFEIRGVYNIYGHGVDLAGNVETGWGSYPIGTLFWPPDGTPNLSESRLTASPSKANAGDTVRYTLGLRNSGVQEAAVTITATVPAGLTVLPASISSGGTYDAASRQVRWQVHAAWPNQPQYMGYDATVDPGSGGQLTTQASLTAYWPGYENDPSKVFTSVLTNDITAGAAPPPAPRILQGSIVEGPVVGNRAVTLDVRASDSAQYLYVKEWTLDLATGAWTQSAASGWLPIAEGGGMTLIADGWGKHLRYDWTLAEGEGVHYLGIWVGDASQQPSSLNESGLLYTNLLGAPAALAAGQRIQYRLPLTEAGLAILTLATTSGDADLNVWEPRDGFKPVHWSNAAGVPPALDSVAFYAPENGDYLVEVQAVTDATFTLALGGALKPAGPEQEIPAQDTLPASVHNADKQRPDHPFALTTPFSLPGAEVPGETVPLTPLKLYLPLIANTASGQAAPAVPDAYPARQRTR